MSFFAGTFFFAASVAGVFAQSAGDDDGDGVPNAVESPDMFYSPGEASKIVAVTSALTSTNSLALLTDGNTTTSTFAFTAGQQLAGAEMFKLEYPFAVPLSSVTLVGVANSLGSTGATAKLQGSVDGSTWVELSTANVSLISGGNKVFPVQQNAGAYKFYRIVGVATATTLANAIAEITSAIDGAAYNASLNPKPAGGKINDLDGDGIANHLDLDTDGDGASDADESGPDGSTYVSLAANAEINATLDFDNDGIPDYLDPDMDGDGISNYLEGYVPDNGPRTLAQWKSDLLIGSFHGAFIRALDGGYYIAGEAAAADGVSGFASPRKLSPLNGYTFTGDVIAVAAGGTNQYALLTTNGLWVWGTINVILPTSTTAFQKFSLPPEIDPKKVVRMSAGGGNGGVALLMQDGTVWVITVATANAAMSGAGLTSTTTSFRQVMLDASTPLTGITDLVFSTGTVFAYSALTDTYYTWGNRVYLGNGSALTSRNFATPTANPLPPGVRMVQIALVNQGTYMVLGTDGRIYVLGHNAYGQAGQGNKTDVLSWTTVKNEDGTGPLEGAYYVDGQNYYNGATSAIASALVGDGKLLSWGYNNSGMLGTGTADRTLPTWPNGEVRTRPVYIVNTAGHFSTVLFADCQGQIANTGHNPGGAFADGSINDYTAYTSGFFLGELPNFCGSDPDNDGVSNWLSLDSDGDGCPDSTEAAPDGRNYDPRALSPSINACLDSDVDGIPDIDDLDDDNDGILDHLESPSCFYTAQEFATTQKTALARITSDLVMEREYLRGLTDGVLNVAAVQFVTSPAQSQLNKQIFHIDMVRPTRLDRIYLQKSSTTQISGGNVMLQGSNDGTTWTNLWTTAANPANTASATTAAGVAVTNVNIFTVQQNAGAYRYYRIYGVAAANALSGSATEFHFDIAPDSFNPSLYPKPDCGADSDNDGIPNHLDLDSDGDGFSDSVEGGNTPCAENDTETIRTGVDANGNGLLDIYETGSTGQLNYYPSYLNVADNPLVDPCLDSDDDGIPDYLDLDDDNDGVPDHLEMDCGAGQSPAQSIANLDGSATGVVSQSFASDTSTFQLRENTTGYRINFGKAFTGAKILLSSINDGPNPSEISFRAVLADGTRTGPLNFELFFPESPKWEQVWTNLGLPLANDNWAVRLGKFTGAPFAAGTPFVKASIPQSLSGISGGNQAWGAVELDMSQISALNPAVSLELVIDTGDNLTMQIWTVLKNEQPGFFCVDLDTDGDGKPNRLDSDSDGDGCSDTYESGSTTDPAVSVISGPYGENGLADSLEAPTSDYIINITKEDFGFVGIPSGIPATGQYTAALNIGGGTGDGARLTDDANRVPGYAWAWAKGTRFVDDGEYAILSNPRLGGYSGFINQTQDNTTRFTGGGGGMLFINGANPGQVAYRQVVNDLSVGGRYQLSAWVSNAVFVSGTTLIQANLIFRIKDANGNIIASNNTGNIPVTSAMDWRKYTLNFSAPTSTITFELVSNASSGGGNDFALDDIEILKAAESGRINYDSTYNNYAVVPSLAICQDTDGDGIPDYLDIDADNDGVPNHLESPGCYHTESEWNSGPKTALVRRISSELTAAAGAGNFTALLDGIGGSASAVQFSTSPAQNQQNKELFRVELWRPTRLDAIYIQKTSATQISGGNLMLQGSNDGSTWTNLFTTAANPANATNVTASGVSLTNSNKYTVATNAAAYRHYRLYGAASANVLAGIASEFYFDVHSASYNPSLYPKPDCSEDIDGDGIPNHLDLDSDSDGTNDAVEAGNTPCEGNDTENYPVGTDANGNGLLDIYESGTTGTLNYTPRLAGWGNDPAFNPCDDADGDGVLDLTDLDDDNDGVTDCEEGHSGGFDFSGITSNASTGITNRNLEPTGYHKFSVVAVNISNLVDNGTTGDALGNFGTGTVSGVGRQTQYRLDFNRPTDFSIRNQQGPTNAGLLTNDEYQIFTANGRGITLNDPANELEIWNGTAWVAVPSNHTAPTIQWRAKATILIGGGFFSFQVNGATAFNWTQVNNAAVNNGVTLNFQVACLDMDTDADGIPNRLDTDSDGDNCPDSFEAGTSTNSFTNTVAGPYGSDGWADSIETNSVPALTNVTYTITNNTIANATAGSTLTTTNTQGGAASGQIMDGTNVAGHWFMSNLRYTRKATGTVNAIAGRTFTATATNNPYGLGGVGIDMDTGGGEPNGIMKYSYQVRVAMNPGYRADKVYFLGNGVITNRGYGPGINATGTGGSIRLNGFSGTGTAFDPVPPDALMVTNGQTFTAGTDLQGYKGPSTGGTNTSWYFSVPAAVPVSYSVDVTGQLSLASEVTGFTVRVVADNYSARALNETNSPCSFPTASITSVTVNEASPYAIVSVTLSQAAQRPVTFTPSLANGTGYVGSDTGTAIEYYNGSAWVSAAAGVTIPAGETSVLLRVAIVQDAFSETSETVQISTGPLSGPIVPAGGLTGTVTINDDGTGDLFSASNTTGTPDAPGSGGLPATLDNDATPPNSDNDGVPDSTDIDDDNDGITDCDEGYSDALNLTGAATGFTNRAVDPDAYTLFSGVPVATAGQLNAPYGDALGNLGLSTKAGNGNDAKYRLVFSRPIDITVRNQFGTAGAAPLTAATEENTFTANGAQIALSDPAGELEIWNGATWVAVPANHTATSIRWRLKSGTLAAGAGSFLFTVTATSSFEWTHLNLSGATNGATLNFRAKCADIDSDGDGTPNRLDTDSDGDGCPDAFESGTSTNSSSLTVPGPYSANNGYYTPPTNTATVLSNVTLTIATNNIALATSGSTTNTTNAFGGSMSGNIMDGTNVAGRWFLSNFRYTRKATVTSNTLTATNFSATNTNNPYGVDGIGIEMGGATGESNGITAFAYSVSVAMNAGYRADQILFLGKNPASGFFYGPSVGTNGVITNNGGAIRASGFIGENAGTVFDPDDNLLATNGQTFSSGTNLLGYKGAEKLPAQTTWYLSVPARDPVTYSVDYTSQSFASANEATAFSVKVVADPYAPATDPTDSACPPPPPAPNAPTVDPLVTNNPTPTLTGTVDLNPGDALSVVVNGNTYTTANGLVINPDGTWSLPLPETPDGTYTVAATVTNSVGVTATDVSADELVIDNTPPATPTVNPLTTNDSTPTLTGTANLAADEELSVTVNGVTYTESDDELVVDREKGTWSLTLPETADGTYNVTATATDPVGNTSTDTTSGELTINTAAPEPVITVDDVTADNILNAAESGQSITITGTTQGAKPGDTVTLTINGKPFTGEVAEDGTYSIPVPGADLAADTTIDASVTTADEYGNTGTGTATHPYTVDITAPAPTITVNDVTEDNILNAAESGETITITGTTSGAQPGDTVTLTINGETFTGQVAADGTYSIPVPGADLAADNTIDASVSSTDAAGNTGTGTAVKPFTVDTTPPTLTVTSVGDDTGTSPTDKITKDNTLTITGKTEPGAEVEIFANGESLGTVTAGPDGTYTFTTPPLADDEYEFTATATDAAGNTSEPVPAGTWTVDTAVNITITTIANDDVTGEDTSGLYDATERAAGPVVISGTTDAEPGSTVVLTINGKNYTTTVEEDGTWEIALTQPDSNALNHGSTYGITASVQDLAGNTAVSSGEVTLDVIIATPDVPTVINQTTSSTTPTIEGSAQKVVTDGDVTTYVPLEEGDSITITLNGVTVTAIIDLDQPNGTNTPGVTYVPATRTWTLDTATAGAFNLEDGTYDVTVAATSGSKSETDISLGELVINSKPPEITIDVIAGDDIITAAEKNQSLTLSGTTTAEVGSIVTLTGPEGDTITAVVLAGLGDAPNYYTVTLPAATVAALITEDGVQTLTASVTNEFGLTGTATRDYTVDTTPPPAPVIELAKDDAGTITDDVLDGGVTDDTLPVLVITAEPGVEVNVYSGGVLVGTATEDPEKPGTYTLPIIAPLAEGPHSFTAVATDDAGNKSPTSTPFDLTVDTTAPVLGITVNSVTPDNILNAAEAGQTITITGTTTGTKVGDTVTLTINGKEYTGIVAADLTYSIQVPGSELALDTTVDASVSSTDEAGNTGTATAEKLYTVDTEAPTPTITIDDVTADNILNAAEAGGNVNITGTTTGTKEGDTVTLTINGNTYTGTVAADGTYSISVPGSDLEADPDATVAASVSTTDAAGNTGTATDTQTYTVATDGPAPVITLDSVTPDNILNAAEAGAPVVVSGSVEGANEGDTVTLTINNKPFTATIGEDGTFSVEVPGADLEADPDTTIAASVTTTDENGNTGTGTATKPYTVDTEAPVVGITVNNVTTDNVLNAAEAGGNVTITGTTIGTQPGDTVTLTINGKPFTGTVAADLSYSISVPGADLAADTTVDASVSSTDEAGNTGTATANKPYTVDTVAPEPTITVNDVTEDNIVNIAEAGGNVTITGTTTGTKQGDTVTLTINGNTYTGTVAADLTYSISVSGADLAADTTVDASVTTTDAAGNTGTGTAEHPYEVDTEAPAPTISIDPVTADNVVNIAESEGKVIITGTTTGTEEGDTVTLTINGVDYTGEVDANGKFSIEVEGSDLAADTAVLGSVTTTDEAGNTGTATDTQPYTVDLEAPKPTITVDNVTADNILNVAEAGADVVITGTTTGTKEGDTVTLTINGKEYTGTVAADLTYSISVPGSDLTSDADKTIDASVSTTDDAGNTGTADAEKEYGVDTTPPALTVTSVGEDTGAASDDKITKDNALTITGTTEPGAEVEIFANGQSLGTVTAGPDGTFSFTTPELADDEYEFTVTATDAAGNTTAPEPAGTWMVDTAVSITITNIAGDAISAENPIGTYDLTERGDDPLTVDTLVTITGETTAEPGQTVVLTLNGKTYTAEVQPDGTWSVELDNDDSRMLNHGTIYPVLASVQDLAGNAASTEAGLGLEVDIAAADVPTVTGLKTSDTTPTVSGTAKKVDPSDTTKFVPLENGDTLSITVNGVTVTATIDSTQPSGTSLPGVTYDPGTGKWTLDTEVAGAFGLTDGTYDVSVTATSDGSSKSDISVGELIINSTPPTITIDPISTDDLINASEKNQSLTLSGTTTAEPGATVTLTGPDGINYTATVLPGLNGAPNYYTVLVPATVVATFTDGEKTLNASVTNEFGKTGTATRDYEVDITPPPAPVITLAKDDVGTITNDVLDNGVTDDNLPVLVITAEAGTTVKVYSGGKLIGTATEDPSKPGTYTLPSTSALAEEPHTFTAIATDDAGNASPSSAPFDLTVDITPPVVTITIDDVTDDNTVNLTESEGKVVVTGTTTGTKEGDTVTLVINGVTYTGTVEADGKFSIEVEGSDLATDADATIAGSVSTTDEAGNVGTATDAHPYTVDITPPTLTITVDKVTEDNILNAAEADEIITITGKTTGTQEGDTVTLTINGNTYTGTVDAEGNYSIEVLGADLAADPNTTIDASVSSTDAAGNTGTATGTQPYTVDTEAPTPTITIDDVTEDNILNAAEAGETITITGTTTGTKEGDTVTLTINGNTYTGTVAADLSYSISVPGADLAADSTVAASVSTTDAAGNTGTATDTQPYTVDTEVPTPTITVDNVTEDNILNAAEAGETITITGTTTDTNPGDTVTLIINGQTFTGLVADDLTFSIDVPGSDLAEDADKTINASVTTEDAAGNTGKAETTKNYGVVGNLSVNSPNVNEGSPFVVFNITGLADQLVTLSFANGSATGDDYGPAIEYFDGNAWIPYSQGSPLPIGDNGQLPVRVAIVNDEFSEGAHDFTLTVSSNGTDSVVGTATILDNGGGAYWIGDAATPATAEELAAADIVLNDDRPLAVNDVSVNEGSPFAVFAVTGAPDQRVNLALANGTATGADYGPALEYFDGTEWVPYVPGSYIKLPTVPGPCISCGEVHGKILVRTPIANDGDPDNGETFKLLAGNTGGENFEGIGTIFDNGAGNYWIGDATAPAMPEELAAADIVLNDDRPLAVNDVSVNEGSPFAVFAVTGAPDQLVNLALANGTATGADYGPALEYFDGTNWVAYVPGSYIKLPTVPGPCISCGEVHGKILVRTPIANDGDPDNGETFTLVAGNTGGENFEGIGTIFDNGDGDYWIGDGTTPATAEELAEDEILLDDDRSLAVNSIIVNEASPFGVFQVTGAPGQLASLVFGAAGDTATSADYGAGLEVYIDGAWVAYTSGQFVELDENGLLLVRVAITPDNTFETSEFFTITATNTGGSEASGTGTIKDNGTGSLFGPNNTTGTPDEPGDNGLAEDLLLDDDRRPFASPDFIEPLPDRPIKFLPSVLLGNDAGDNLKLVNGKWTTALGGTVEITARAVTYTPPPGGLGPDDIDSFDYTVTNPYGSDTGTVRLIAEERALTLPIKIISATDMPTGGKMVRLCALPKMQYEIFATSTLESNAGSVRPETGLGSNWELVGVYTANERGDIYVPDVNAGTQRFYRLRIRP